MEVSKSGIEPSPQQWLKLHQWQCWTFNPLAARELWNFSNIHIFFVRLLTFFLHLGHFSSLFGAYFILFYFFFFIAAPTAFWNSSSYLFIFCFLGPHSAPFSKNPHIYQWKVTIIANIYRVYTMYLPCARHAAKCFTWIISFSLCEVSTISSLIQEWGNWGSVKKQVQDNKVVK